MICCLELELFFIAGGVWGGLLRPPIGLVKVSRVDLRGTRNVLGNRKRLTVGLLGSSLQSGEGCLVLRVADSRDFLRDSRGKEEHAFILGLFGPGYSGWCVRDPAVLSLSSGVLSGSWHEAWRLSFLRKARWLVGGIEKGICTPFTCWESLFSGYRELSFLLVFSGFSAVACSSDVYLIITSSMLVASHVLFSSSSHWRFTPGENTRSRGVRGQRLSMSSLSEPDKRSRLNRLEGLGKGWKPLTLISLLPDFSSLKSFIIERLDSSWTTV